MARHPLLEPFHYQLMAALYRCGRRADALAAYRSARGVLVDELGIEPGPDLRQLHQRILDDEPGEAPRAVRAPRGQAPRQLPPPVPDFVGRTSELAELRSAPAGRTRWTSWTTSNTRTATGSAPGSRAWGGSSIARSAIKISYGTAHVPSTQSARTRCARSSLV